MEVLASSIVGRPKSNKLFENGGSWQALRQIRHEVEIGRILLVDPLVDLMRPIRLDVYPLERAFELAEGDIEEVVHMVCAGRM